MPRSGRRSGPAHRRRCMPIHLEISRLNRLLVIVARGQVTPDDVRDLVKQMVDNDVRHFSKIIDVSGSSIEMSREQVEAMAVMLRAEKGAATRGPIAFVDSSRAPGLCRPLRRCHQDGSAGQALPQPARRPQMAAGPSPVGLSGA